MSKKSVVKTKKKSVKDPFDLPTDMNMNEFAQRISVMEGGKVNLTEPQIKEVMRCIALECFRDRATKANFDSYSIKIGKKAMVENDSN